MRDKALTAMKPTLNNWLTASSGESDHLFYYDQNWGTLIGYDASYGSDQELNDHHFHYGYFIAAAATVAKFDPDWATSSQYGGMIDLLIRDANNYDRDDTRFPYLRDFDIYAGHDWASGHGSFASGNNQESSSEGMNFAGALIQWGQATGNTAVRDAGIYIYTTQAAAIEDYWFDVDNDVFPAEFGHSTVGMVWGDGGAYATWFTRRAGEDPGHQPAADHRQPPLPGSEPGLQQDQLRRDGPQQRRRTAMPGRTSCGSSWPSAIPISALASSGPTRTSPPRRASPRRTRSTGSATSPRWATSTRRVTANHPLAAVFVKDGQRSYVAANISSAADHRDVLQRHPGERAGREDGRDRRPSWSGGSANGQPGTPTRARVRRRHRLRRPRRPRLRRPTPTRPRPRPDSDTHPDADPRPPHRTDSATCTASGGPRTRRAAASAVTVEAANWQSRRDAARRARPSRPPASPRAYTGGAPSFDLFVDAGNAVGSATQLRLSYDLTGNGSLDRVETYRYFATDPVPGYEHYTQARPAAERHRRARRTCRRTVKVEVWNAIGNQPTTLGVGNQSVVKLPFS